MPMYLSRILVGGTILTLATVGAIAFGEFAPPLLSALAAFEPQTFNSAGIRNPLMLFSTKSAIGPQDQSGGGDVFLRFTVAFDSDAPFRELKKSGFDFETNTVTWRSLGPFDDNVLPRAETLFASYFSGRRGPHVCCV